MAPAGSVAISTRAPIGHTGILSSVACTNQGCRLLVPNEAIQPEHLYYSLKVARPELESLGQGTTFAELSRDELARFAVPVAPRREQAAIVRFLDHADRHIGGYIRAKQQLIALLEEQKQAVIHQAVTGQIDVRTGQPYPAYKDSGVEWLGRVPENWEEMSLGATAQSIQTGPFGSQLHSSEYVAGGVPVINPSHMANGRIQPDPSVAVGRKKADELSVHQLWFSDIVVARRGEIGRCGLVTEKETGWLCGTGSLRIRLKPRVLLPVYLVVLLNASLLRDTLSLTTIGATMDNVNAGIVSRLRLALPPYTEQAPIVECLNQATADIHTAINCSRRQIKLMNEFRSCLVADVATGKLDVRELAAKLPPVGGSVDMDELVGLEADATSYSEGIVAALEEVEGYLVSG